MKKQLNPEVNIGDKIVCYYMEGETSVLPGTKGVVTEISRDPFEPDGKIISVDWENGSKLSLLTVTDAWKLDVPKKKIDESFSLEPWDVVTKNPDALKYFDWRWFRFFLEKVRKSGIVNMFAAAPLLYSSKEHIIRYYGEDMEDDEDFQEMIEDADESKNKIIQGVMKYMEDKGIEFGDLSKINRLAEKFSREILNIFMAMPPNK